MSISPSSKAKSFACLWVCQAARLVLKHGVFQGRAQQDLSRIVQIIEGGTRKP
jgi:2-hydroxy-3-oxopropionate reductase